jgi:hypothetical protein
MSDDRVINHKLHIFLSLITLSLWTTFYIIIFIIFLVSGSTIESRRNKRVIAKESRRNKKAIRIENLRTARLNAPVAKPVNKGYKTKSFYMNGSMAYTLACGHQIRSAKQVGMFSKGLLMKTVWCDICKDHRTVTGTLDPWIR